MKTRRRIPKTDWRKAVALLAARNSLFSVQASAKRTQPADERGPQQTGQTGGGDK